MTFLQTVTFYAKEDEERKRLNEELRKKRERRHLKEADESGSDLNINSKAILTWENLCYDVPTPSGQLRLLNDIFGYVVPGQLTALMGTFSTQACCIGILANDNRRVWCWQNNSARRPRGKEEYWGDFR